MSTSKDGSVSRGHVSTELSAALGVRRTMTLRRIMRQCGLPPEVLLDLALEMLDIASRKLSPSPIKRQAVGLGAARWRNVTPAERSEAARQAAQARWKKHRPAASEGAAKKQKE